MLLRCCTATLLLLVGVCAKLFNDPYLQPFYMFHSFERGVRYSTKVFLGTRLYEDKTYMRGFTSVTFNTEAIVISRVNVRFSKLLNIDKRRFEELSGLRWITNSPFVKDFWLGDWPGARSLSVHMYNMSMNQKYVSNLRDDALTELELTGNSWTTTTDLFLELESLKKLSLADNQIEELHRGLLKGCFSLEVLDLSRNKISSYSDVLLSLMPVRLHLKELSLAENIITKFEKPFSYSNFQVKKLNVSYNQITYVDVWSIEENCEVDLSFNNITMFSSCLCVFRVDRMVLAGQNISSLSEVDTILHLINGERVGNSIYPFDIDSGMFEYSIPNVEIVYDHDSPLGRFTVYVPQRECTVHRPYIHCLESASNISTSPGSSLINLTGNTLRILKSSVCSLFVDNILDLSENNLKVLSDAPWVISDTKQLNLSRNSIGYINRHFFENMTRLTVVDLSYNQLKHVQIILHSSLFMLDISYNYLNRMNISHNSSQYITKYLNLSHNSFTNILKAEWSQFDQFSKVDLGENNFQCCSPEGQHSRSMFLIYRNKILNINSSKALTCVRPYYGRVEMTDTWLSEDHCQFNLQGWVGFGCLVLLLPLIIHGVDLVDYFMHQAERDLAERLTRLKKQGLEEDENCALDCEYDAFVCHSHKDASWVTHELVPNLENDRDGHCLCIHYRNFQLGSFIEENVEKAMNTSRKVIVVVTRSFLQSNWCKMELTFAWEKMVREGRNYIIVIEVDRIPKGKRPPILSYLMRSRTYLEWPEAPTEDVKQECWSRVWDALGKSLRDRQQELSESGLAAFQMDC